MNGRAHGTDKRARFLAILVETGGNVSASCRAVKIGRTAVYRWRHEDPVFAREMDAALELSTQTLEDEAIRRAHTGVVEPVYQKGQLVGHVRRYSDRLLEFLLRARRPEVYRETAPSSSAPPAPGNGRVIDQISRAEAAAMVLIGSQNFGAPLPPANDQPQSLVEADQSLR